ncbi:MAG: DNA polymerase III subunit beta [Gammaproteobacteria bacterium]|jgi:DNA polymerase-3 subunit beta|nr:DNA polymerase III subunit beta [Gammaproteobacteria bacterium]|tara:strand:+ start:10659 stop:11759 length:1101 start_codon:yes stop_codon:yes gene_type:complete
MKFSINREVLLRPLQQVAGVVERRQTLPVLANVLMQVTENQLSMTGTDLEVELVGRVELEGASAGEITVPARKLVDICREIPEKAEIEFGLNDQRLEIKSGRFRSNLSTLPADDFPAVDSTASEMSSTVESKAFKKLLDSTGFAMAQQDVRYFLNGMLIEIGSGRIRSVSTDGHRLAMGNLTVKTENDEMRQVIVPRKGIVEIQRLLNELEGDVEISLGAGHVCVSSRDYTLTSKLVDGRFPEYERVIPRNGDKIIFADRVELRQALNRTAILSNEKFRGIRVILSKGSIQLSANNPEQEEAEETVSVEYDGEGIEIGFNVSYLQDVLGVLESDKVKLTLHDGNSSALLEDPDNEDTLYVVMPMKL